MTKAPLVSIIIPAYNAAKTLEATVQSVFEQTLQDFEIIITDDGSKDNTLEVAREIAASDSRVKVIAQENGGAAAARNTSLQAAIGKYAALLDADDLWLPEKLDRQIEFLEANPEIQAVQCGAFFVNNELSVLSVHHCTDTGNSFRETLLFQNLPAFLSALTARRDRIMEVGMFDTELEILEEWDMALKMARFCAMRSITDPLVKYRVHEGNRHRNVDIHIKPGLLVLQRLFAEPDLPPEIKDLQQQAFGTFYRTLAGGYYNSKQILPFIRWTFKSLFTDPAQIRYMLKLPLRIARRRLSRRLVTETEL